jgi:IS6 family transposase
MKHATQPAIFKWRQTVPELILYAVRWYLRYSLSLRDVKELLAERGLAADRDIGAAWAAAEPSYIDPSRNRKWLSAVDDLGGLRRPV